MAWTNPSDGELVEIFGRVRRIAIVGASANMARPSYFVASYLAGRGYEVIAVNPGLASQPYLGRPAVARLSEIGEPVDMVDIFRDSTAAAGVVDDALALSPRPSVIWMQLGVVNEAAARRAKDAGVTVVMDRCPKIEIGRLSGEIGWQGVNSRTLSSRRRPLSDRVQRLALPTSRAGAQRDASD